MSKCRQDDVLVGPKSGNVEEVFVLNHVLKGQRGHEDSKESFKPSEPGHLGECRGRVNPPPRRLVWRFLEVWRVCCLVQTSTRLEARGLGGLKRNERTAER